MDYDRSSHSKYLILYHIILVTKYRHRILNLIDIKYIFKNIEKESNFDIIEMEVDIDHIHFLIKSYPKYSISQIIRRLKVKSTILSWKKYYNILIKYYWKQRILWSDGYFVCTIGNVSKETIQQYIKNQG
jgi:putative transposase